MSESPATVMEKLRDELATALRAFCLYRTGNDRARAETFAQGALLRAWRYTAVLKESSGSVRWWLFTAARDVVIAEWRTWRAQCKVQAAKVPDVDTARNRTDQLLSWAGALTTLSSEHRRVLLECFYRGHPVAEAVPRLGVREETGNFRHHCARRGLGLALEEMGVGS